jgi:hypothetical protein
MNMRLSSRILIGSFCSILLLSNAMAATSQNTHVLAPAKVQITKPIYTWRTESENDKTTGKFDHCLVKNMYDNGTLMILAENNEGVKRIGLDFPQQKMNPGQQFDLAIQVDKRDVFPVEAAAISPQTMAIPIPDALPDQMRKGQTLHLRGPNDEVAFDLAGMDGAVMALHDCIIAQKNSKSPVMVASNNTEEDTAIATAPVPVPTPAPAPVQKKQIAAVKAPVVKQELGSMSDEMVPVVASNNTPVKPVPSIQANPLPDKIIAPPPIAPIAAAPATSATINPVTKSVSLQDNKVVEVANDQLPSPWQEVFAMTPYAPQHLIPMKNKTPYQPLDYIWKNQDVFIGVKAKNVKPGDALNAMSVDYLSMLKGRCKGNFVAQSSATQQSGRTNITWQLAEVACSNSKNGDSIAAMIFAFTPQGGQIYFFEAKAHQGSDAIKARDAIVKNVLK